MIVSHSIMSAHNAQVSRNTRVEECPSLLCEVGPPPQRDLEKSQGLIGKVSSAGASTLGASRTAAIFDDDGYDEIDRRLIDTFPASDAVARY
jgi:hypothetical protein